MPILKYSIVNINSSMETLVMQISKLVSLFFLVLVLLNLFYCIPDAKEFRTPAEWERQESVWLAWPVFDSIKGRHASDVTESIVRELSSFIKVDLIVQDENEKTKIISNFTTKKIPFSHVRFHIVPHNYLITNGAVLIPKYWKEGRSEQIQKKDQAAVRILSQLFPDRKIIQINPENVNIGGGGIHCITQQMPAAE